MFLDIATDRDMSKILVPEGLEDLVKSVDEKSGTLELDAERLWRLIDANPQLDWSNDLVPELLLAHWFVTQSNVGTLDPHLEQQLQRLDDPRRLH